MRAVPLSLATAIRVQLRPSCIAAVLRLRGIPRLDPVVVSYKFLQDTTLSPCASLVRQTPHIAQTPNTLSGVCFLPGCLVKENRHVGTGCNHVAFFLTHSIFFVGRDLIRWYDLPTDVCIDSVCGHRRRNWSSSSASISTWDLHSDRLGARRMLRCALHCVERLREDPHCRKVPQTMGGNGYYVTAGASRISCRSL